MITATELRRKYIDFFRSKGHTEIPSASLVPENDPSTLFVTAGMHPLIPYLMGQKHPAGTRLVDAQKCVRTGDIDDVGDNRHLTFFEMLGNWSLGDYFKAEAIEWSFEFLTDKEAGLGLDPKRLLVTVFKGGDGVPRDEESIRLWKKVFREKAGMTVEVAEDGRVSDEKRIVPLGKEDNFWIAGATGPCGGDSEMFYDTRPEEELKGDFNGLVDNYRLMEIWNDVFMEFEKKPDGSLVALQQKNVDTGMGLDRTIVVLNGYNNVFETELFQPLLKKIEELSGKKYTIKDFDATPPSLRGEEGFDHVRNEIPECWEEVARSMRIIADHIRAATFILADRAGVEPSNVDQGYVARKLIRRAIRHGRMIGITDNFTDKVAGAVIDLMGSVYSELEENRERVLGLLRGEEEKFGRTLQNGLKKFGKIIEEQKNKNQKLMAGEDAFDLFQSYGFPLELTIELARENGLTVDKRGFQEAMEEHQELSRTASVGKFRGGLAASSEMAIKYHTATHLLHQALRDVLGDQVEQRGSNITEERLRFDFSHDRKMTSEQKQEVERIVNEKIAARLPVKTEAMTVDEAKAKGAIGLFGHKYGDKVKVYSVGNYSKEICGGPHVENIGALGHFWIKKEEASSAGVRRIKAVLE